MDFRDLFERAARDQVLVFLALTVAVLFGIALVFGAMTVFLRIHNIRKGRRWGRLEADWTPLLLDILAGQQSAAALQKRVGKRDRAFFVDFLARYGRRIRGRDRQTLVEIARPFMQDVAARWSRGDAEHRAHSMQLLGALGLPEYAREAQAGLDDPSPLVAMIAARGMARKDHPELAEGLLDKIHRFDNWSTGFLATMLSNVGSELATVLRKVLSDASRPPRTRAVAAEALLRLRDLSAADEAAPLLQAKTPPDLLASVLRLIAAVGRQEHRDLVRPLCNSKEFAVRTQAIAALGSLGDMEDVPTLRRAFMDHSPWVAIQAAWGLRNLGAEELLTILAEQKHPRAELARQVLAGHR